MGTGIVVIHCPIGGLKAIPEEVLLLPSLTPAVIPGIPVNIPTVLDLFFCRFSPLVADRTPHSPPAIREPCFSGLPQQVQPMPNDGSAGVRC